MEIKFSKTRLIKWVFWIFFAVCTMAALHWLLARTAETHWWASHYTRFIRTHPWILLDASAWASWVQALGAMLAIFISYFLFQRQRKHEFERGRDMELFARAKSVQIVQAVGFWVIELIDRCADIRECNYADGVIPGIEARLDELRLICDSFVCANGDRISVLCALNFSQMLAETKADFTNTEPTIVDLIVERLRDRYKATNSLYERLLEHQNRLDEMCRLRGMEPENTVDSLTEFGNNIF